MLLPHQSQPPAPNFSGQRSPLESTSFPSFPEPSHCQFGSGRGVDVLVGAALEVVCEGRLSTQPASIQTWRPLMPSGSSQFGSGSAHMPAKNASDLSSAGREAQRGKERDRAGRGRQGGLTPPRDLSQDLELRRRRHPLGRVVPSRTRSPTVLDPEPLPRALTEG